MTFEESYQLSQDFTWQGRCIVAACAAATNVSSEDPATVGHEKRAEFATSLMLNPSAYQVAIAHGVAAQPGITGSSATDNDIQFTVNSLWNVWSGVV